MWHLPPPHYHLEMMSFHRSPVTVPVSRSCILLDQLVCSIPLYLPLALNRLIPIGNIFCPLLIVLLLQVLCWQLVSSVGYCYFP
jgi:hypothetical protein